MNEDQEKIIASTNVSEILKQRKPSYSKHAAGAITRLIFGLSIMIIGLGIIYLGVIFGLASYGLPAKTVPGGASTADLLFAIFVFLLIGGLGLSLVRKGWRRLSFSDDADIGKSNNKIQKS